MPKSKRTAKKILIFIIESATFQSLFEIGIFGFALYILYIHIPYITNRIWHEEFWQNLETELIVGMWSYIGIFIIFSLYIWLRLWKEKKENKERQIKEAKEQQEKEDLREILKRIEGKLK